MTTKKPDQKPQEHQEEQGQIHVPYKEGGNLSPTDIENIMVAFGQVLNAHRPDYAHAAGEAASERFSKKHFESHDGRSVSYDSEKWVKHGIKAGLFVGGALAGAGVTTLIARRRMGINQKGGATKTTSTGSTMRSVK